MGAMFTQSLSLFPEAAAPPLLPPSPSTPSAPSCGPAEGKASASGADNAPWPAAVWRATELGAISIPTVSTGFSALDDELPGRGWPTRNLTEILQRQSSVNEWRLLGPMLKGLVAEGGQVVLIGPPQVPHMPGLQHHGLTEKAVSWISATTASERLWVTEQVIKANVRGAVLAWLPQARPEQLRRLQVHAQSCDAPVFLFRPIDAQHNASPAPLRVLSVLGTGWQVKLHVMKRKGPVHAGWVVLSCVPGGLASVLPPRLQHLQPLAPREAQHVDMVGGLAPQRHRQPVVTF
jgi:protein ImuA